MFLDKVVHSFIIVLLTIIVLAVFYRVFGKTNKNSQYVEYEEYVKYNFTYLCKKFIEYCHDIERHDYENMNLNRGELDKRLGERDDFQTKRRICHTGNLEAKQFMVSEAIKFLINTEKITYEKVEEIWDMTSDDQPADFKFFVLSYIYNNLHNDEWLDKLIEEFSLCAPKEDGEGSFYYSIDEEDIHRIWQAKREVIDELSELDKVSILGQRIYQSTLGNGQVDLLLDAKIDGVSGGLSGVPSSAIDIVKNILGRDRSRSYKFNFNSIWIMYNGNQTHMRFLGFRSARELIRICENIYSCNNSRHLSESLGHIANTRADGSRAVVFRPSFSMNWVFFVRKFGTGRRENPYELFKGKHSNKAIDLIKWQTRGKLTTIFSGGQGSGKTTLITSIIRFIHAALTIRTLQLTSEMWLNRLYPEKNIAEIFETPTVSGQRGLDALKKSDCNVIIVGESANYEVTSYFLQSCETGSDFGLTTSHQNTPDDLMDYCAQAQVIYGGLSIQAAQERAARLIRFNVHLEKNITGIRSISRITEFGSVDRDSYKVERDAPLDELKRAYYLKQLESKYYTHKNLLECIDGEYYFTNTMSQENIQAIRKNLSESELKEFNTFLINMQSEVESGIALKAKAQYKQKLELRGV